MTSAVQESRFGVFPRDFFEKCVENQIINIVEAKLHYPRADYAVEQFQRLSDLQHACQIANDRQSQRYYNRVVYDFAACVVVLSRKIRNYRSTKRLHKRASACVQQRIEKHLFEVHRLRSAVNVLECFEVVENIRIVV